MTLRGNKPLKCHKLRSSLHSSYISAAAFTQIFYIKSQAPGSHSEPCRIKLWIHVLNFLGNFPDRFYVRRNLLCRGSRKVFPLGGGGREAVSGWVMNLTKYLHLVSRLRMVGSIHPPLHIPLQQSRRHSYGDRGGTVVKVLCYKSEGRWFDPRWYHWNFSLT